MIVFFMPGIVGVMQATEVVKLIIGKGNPLIGRMMVYDALDMKFRELKLRRDIAWPIGEPHPRVKELVDYEQFCGLPSHNEAAG